VLRITLVKVVGDGQMTLPAEAREALQVHEGAYVQAEVVENGVMLTRAAAPDRARGWDRVMAIVNRPKWRGPGPEPSGEELLEEAVEEIHAMRAEDTGHRSCCD
jgi:bifunctional DNA-binding transcriptional regulator/antitoxin component of YhaV-PrlF toxin-antitoxin module